MTVDAGSVADEVFSSAPELASVPGVAFGVVHDGVLVHSGGYGAATVGGPTPSASTVFRIASMTKSFTAAAVLMLRDEGLLRLDDPVADHLPAARVPRCRTACRPSPSATCSRWAAAWPPTTPGATGRSRCRWTSSTPWWPAASPGAGRRARCSSTRTPATRCSDGSSRRPRARRSRSSSASGCARRSGMASTRFDALDVDPARLATGYRVTADGTHVPEPLVAPGAYSAMGGLLSTVEDLAHWVGGMTAAWRDDAPPHPVDRWSLREMQEIARFVATETTTGTGAGTVAVGYGYGLTSMHHDVLGRIVAHSGGYPGFGSHMRWHPASGWGVVALGNATYAPMHVPVAEVLARIVVETGSGHGATPRVPVIPWPRDARGHGRRRGAARRRRQWRHRRLLVAEHGPRPATCRAPRRAQRRPSGHRPVRAGCRNGAPPVAGPGRLDRDRRDRHCPSSSSG